MRDLIIGLHVDGTDPTQLLAQITLAERAGVQCAWMTSSRVSPDPLAVFAAAALKTERILFGTSIIPTFPRHPLALAQGAVVVDTLAPGRLRLGVGPSHKPTIEETFGLPFQRPLEHLREYILILRTLFESGKVDFQGRRLKARAALPHPIQVPVMASALRPASFRLCGEIAQGAISWVCPLPYLRDVAIPAIKEGADLAHREAPPLIAHVPVVVSEDREAALRGSIQRLSRYPQLPFYAQMFQDAGFPEAASGELSNRLLDALVVSGTAEQVKERLRTVPSYGAHELLAMPIHVRGDEQALNRTISVLGELARE